MKLNKIMLSAAAVAALSAVTAAAQVSFHSDIDFTTYAVQQDFTNTNGTKSNTEPSAAYDPDGSFKIDVNATASSFAFELGLYFNPDGGLSTDYYDISDLYSTHFYKGNMKVGFLGNQLQLYIGKFEDFNADYIAGGYVVDDQSITNLADSTFGQYFTGLEYAPSYLPGLRVIAGLPIMPIMGNGEHYSVAYAQWKNLWKKVKVAASYMMPLGDYSLQLNAGYRYGTFYDGIQGDAATYTTDSELATAYTKSAFGEGYIQAILPGFMDLGDITVSYDIRHRNADYVNISAETVEKLALAHYAQVGFATKLMDNELALNVEDRFFYADDDYVASNEKVLWDMLAVNAEYALPGTIFSVGADLAGMFAADANGTGIVDGAINNTKFAADSDNITMTFNGLSCAAATGEGATTYIGAYACPYLKINFSNGALKIGAEVAYTRFFTSDVTNTCFAYRVPVGLNFAF